VGATAAGAYDCGPLCATACTIRSTLCGAPAPIRPPAQEHWLGLDQLGRDVMSRLIWGTRYTVLTATLSTGIALLFGLVVGEWLA